jgi:hypothetical protein
VLFGHVLLSLVFVHEYLLLLPLRNRHYLLQLFNMILLNGVNPHPSESSLPHNIELVILLELSQLIFEIIQRKNIFQVGRI